MKSDFHIHSTFSDGKSTPEEMAETEYRRGFERIGFSDHSYTPFDPSYCMKRDSVAYIDSLRFLQEKYRGKMEILIGVEKDMYSPDSYDEFDYKIGSKHYIYADGEYFAVDRSWDELMNGCNKHFGGDIMALCENYFSELSKIGDYFKPDIIGHFDLICKYNEDDRYFDTNAPRYVAAEEQAIKKLVKLGVPFEINVGAISRKKRTTPYPSARAIRTIYNNGGKFVYGSDSHHRDYAGFMYDGASSYLKNICGADFLEDFPIKR